jgi:pimeloyl-ACP methyl ester carboxylesterase
MFRSTLILLAALLLAPDVFAEPLELEDCRISAGPGSPSMKARCATMLRPLDPTGAEPGEIELRVVVVPALNLKPEPDPFVPIAGGPGQGSVQFYAAYSSAFEPVRRDRDILLVDQRGTGESSRMDCPVDEELVEGQYSRELTIEYTNECLAELPHDPRFFTTSVAVTDLEAVRAALAYPTLNLYGVSYGSRVAQHFARRYPDATRTLILDGVVPPQVPLGPEIATESQKAVDRVLARCAEDTDCHERFPQLRATFKRVVDALKQSPVSIDVPHPSSGRVERVLFGHSEMAVAIRLLAYNPMTIALMPLLISEAGKGNYVPLASQYQMTMIAMSDAMALGMHNAVMCSEDAPRLAPEDIDYDSLSATYMGAMQMQALEAICSVWPAGPSDAGLYTPLATDLPVLLLSGDADPITPPRYADMAAEKLLRSRHLVGKHQGHGQVSVGCMPRLVATFVATADPDAVDPECVERSFVMPFFLDFSGPTP